ncbi:BZIP domain-containing protein [Aphelenchoides bicaudatus]|nr:BZIP domain-containing protein [Aphelenchoides bicaudatus]
MDEFWAPIVKDNVLFTDATSPETNYIYEASSSRPPSQFSSANDQYLYLDNDDGYASNNYVYDSSSSTSPPSHFSANGSYVCLDNEEEYVMLSNDYANHAAAHRGAQFVQDTESDLMPPIPPTRTRGKMHDLAVKRCLITTGNTRSTGGLVILSAEEKRTLVQEGYELPTTLPLSREQEEALKILSAQESRRKRKEYIDSLEKKVHSYYSEVMSLRSRLKQAETQNRDLNSQLKHYRASVDSKDGLL